MFCLQRADFTEHEQSHSKSIVEHGHIVMNDVTF